MSKAASRAGAIAAGLVLDRLVGEPPNSLHPVAWFGTAMGRVERYLWADRRAPGVAYATTGMAVGLLAGMAVRSTTVAVGVAVAGNALRATAAAVGQAVASDDLHDARSRLRSLVGRDPTDLDAAGISAAVIESVAENSVDAVIAPVFWAVIGGAPGALAYRAINTMDAMVGHRSDRYRNFGTAAARLDDVANWVPARIFAGLVATVRPRKAAHVQRIVRRDAPNHPSPNAGVAESAMAAVLDRKLGGSLRYGSIVEHRPLLGDGPNPQHADISEACRVASNVEWLVVAALSGVAVANQWRL